jgi:dolichol-phosphate mannosyltransferase
MSGSSCALSVVAPAFNEEEGIEQFVAEVCGELDGFGCTYELICVDDGSTDSTRARLSALCVRFPSLRPVKLDGHYGQSAALAGGIELARGEIIVLIDADLQNDPRDIARLVGVLDAHCDCVVGVRVRRRDNWLRRLSSRVANWMSRRITREEFSDAGCGLKVCRAPLLKQVPMFRGAHRFFGPLIKQCGGHVKELQVNHRPRMRGQSKYGHGLGRTFTALRDALGVRWLGDRKLRYRVAELAASDAPAQAPLARPQRDSAGS